MPRPDNRGAAMAPLPMRWAAPLRIAAAVLGG